jgi:hypothetical protein
MERLSIDLFRECSDFLRFDEIISAGMDTKASMTALDLGNPRIDSHLIAHGIFDITDLSGVFLPDESITADEVRKILGFLFDCQIARLAGFSLFQNVLTCIYLQQNFVIKNPILRTLLYAFIPAQIAIEAFGRGIGHLFQPGWTVEHTDSVCFLPVVNIDDVERELLVLRASESDLRDLVEFSLFQISFARYLRAGEGRLDFVAPPSVAEPIGFVPEIHYRQLPIHTPPPRQYIPTHDEARRLFQSFIDDLSGIASFPRVCSVRELIRRSYDWSQAHDNALNFTRMWFLNHIFPLGEEPVIYDEPFGNWFRRDLLEHHCPSSSFEHEKFDSIAEQMFQVARQTIRACVAPSMQGHRFLCDQICRIWSYLQQTFALYRLELVRPNVLPKVSFEEHATILQNPFTIWSVLPAADITRYVFELGIANGIYGERDWPFLFAALGEAYSSIAQFSKKTRLLDAIYAASAKNKPNKKSGRVLPVRDAEVAKALAPETPEELEAAGLSDYLFGCFHVIRFCRKVGAAVPLRELLFYNEKDVYKERIKAVSTLLQVGVWKYDGFASAFQYERNSPDELKEIASNRFRKAKTELVKAAQAEKTPARENFVKAVVMSSLTLAQWKPGQTIDVLWENGIPRFSFAAK